MLIWLTALLWLAMAGWGQETIPPDQLPPPPPIPGPTEPTPPATEEPVPPGRIRILAERYIISEADQLFQAIGNVTVLTPDVTINGAEASYSLITNLVLVRGNVSIRAADGNTYWGNVLEYNARTGEWEFIDWSVEYPPGFLGAPFIAPVYLGGRNVTGLPGRVQAADTSVTTCNLPNPHYVLIAERVDIYPGDKLIARNTDIYVLGQKVLTVPWFFLSLKQNRQPIVPEFGQNDYEGYFLRLLYQYVLDPDQLGGIRLDLTEKLGAGLGINHFYTIPRGTGEAFLYGRQDLSEYAVRVDHTQYLPADIVAQVRADIRENSLFTYQPTTNTDLNLNVTRQTPHSNSQLNLTRRLNEGTFSSDTTSGIFSYNQNTAGGRLTYRAEYSRFGQASFFGPAQAADEELWNRIHWVRRMGFGDLNLRIDDRSDLDEEAFTGDRFFSGLQRLPEVYLESNSSQIGWDLLQRVPSRFTVGWGHFDERPGDTQLDRYLFNWQLQSLTVRRGNTRFTPTAGVRQTFYGDADFTALYAYTVGLSARTEITPRLSNTARYTTQESHGFTPFRFDNIYPYETITDGLEYRSDKLRFSASSGRDLRNQRWQDLVLRADYEFTPEVTMTHATAFDLNNDRWRDLVSEFRWQRDPLVSLAVSTRYNLAQSQLSTVSTNLGWVIGPWWRLQWLGGYDGVRRELLYNEFLLIRDLHCWDAALYYSHQREYFYLQFRLKALNLPLPGFGIGRGGQVLDTGQGVPF